MDNRTYTLEQLTGKPQRGWAVIMAVMGLLGIAVGTLLPIINIQHGSETVGDLWKYVYAGGALLFTAGKLLSPYTGVHPRIRRLCRIESWSGVFFCVAAFFLFYNGSYTRDSWAFTLAGGALMVFTTISIPRVIRKELKKNQTK